MQHKLFTILLSLLTGGLMSACVGTTDFLAASFLPGALGHVTLKMNQDSNYVIQVYLRNLTQVHDAKPARPFYVVWMVSDRGITKNIGEFKYSFSMFSNTSKSTFRPDSPLKPARIYITAEDNPGVQYSNTEIVFSTGKFQE